MIEIKANVESIDEQNNEAEVAVSCHLESRGDTLIHEATTVIRSLTSHLKETDELLHLMLMNQIANDPTILFGEDTREDRFKAEMANMSSKSILKGGLN